VAGGPLTIDAMASRAPLVSVNIPCYHQLGHARRCVQSALAQTLGDLEVNLLDDGDSDEYRDYVGALGDDRVHYQRNPQRLGAMRNMFQAITAGRGKYTIAFHEDDLLGAHYLATALGVLEADASCGFVGGRLREFKDEPAAEMLAAASANPAITRYGTSADLLRGILRGIEPMFGSIVYRRAAVECVHAEHDAFATLVDRPFLLAIMEGWSSAIIEEPMVWYRHHGEGDTRHMAMNPDHILRLFERYRAALPVVLGAEDQALFYEFAGYWLFTLFRLVPPAQQGSLRRFTYRAWREGLYNPRWSRGLGRKQLLAMMLTGR
jgi:glycosyltransferase involved in cell wall biosynthesis